MHARSQLLTHPDIPTPTQVLCASSSSAEASGSSGIMVTKLDKRIGFIGAGQMAEALARGLINKGVLSASQICCNDPAAARKELFKSLGGAAYDTNIEVRWRRRWSAWRAMQHAACTHAHAPAHAPAHTYAHDAAPDFLR